ncbi:MAG: hypothetical protein LBF97_06280, partial [Elusimicrobiota bacterium]|nr:hypothetical protein [Elusimicrobiota bacterium]
MISFKEYHTLKEADMETAKDIIQDIQDLVRKNDGKFTDETEKHVNKAIQKNKDDISTLENILNAVTGYLQNPTSAMERVLTGRMFQITKQLKPKNKKPEEKGKAAQAEPPPKEEGSAEEVDDGDEELSPNNPNVREKIEETPTPDNDTEKALISALQSKDFKTAFVTLRQFVRDSIDKTAFSDFSKVKHVLSNMNDQETPFDLKKLLPLMKDPISAIPIIANLVYAGTMTQKAFELMGQADKDAFVDNKVKRFRKMLNGTGASNLESLVGLYRDSMGDMRMKIKALKRIPDPPKFDQEFSLKTAQNFVTAGIGKIKKEEHIGKLNNALKIFQKWKEGDTKKLDEVIQKEKDPSQVIEVIARNKGLDVNELKQFIDTNYKEQETPPSKNPNDNQENITKKTENPPAGSSDNSSGEIKGSPPSKNSQDDFSDPSQEKPPSEQNNIKDNKENQTPKLQSEEDYINEINKICDAALEHIKKNYGKKEDVQESINKAIKTVIQEGIGIFRTHRSDGTETKSYANAKQKVEDEASALIEKFRNAAIQQVTKYWDAAYGDKIISTNGRFNAKVKVKNAIPQLNAKLAKLRYKSGKKTSQNLVGMVAGGVTEAGKTIVGDVGKSISNSSLGRRVKDLAKTGAQLAKDKAQEIKRLDNDNTSANTLAALVEIEKDTTKLIEIQKQLKPYFERAKIANPKLTPEQFVKGKALPLRLNWEKEKIKTNSTADWYNIFQTQPAEAQKVLSKSLSSITANEMPKEKEEE